MWDGFCLDVKQNILKVDVINLLVIKLLQEVKLSCPWIANSQLGFFLNNDHSRN